MDETHVILPTAQECEIEMREEEKSQRKNYKMNCKVLRGNSAAGHYMLETELETKTQDSQRIARLNVIEFVICASRHRRLHSVLS